jgi:hypothetical protein
VAAEGRRGGAHPWFVPIERRVGTFLVCVAWLGFEIWAAPGDFWFWLALAMTGYAVWDFFLSGKYSPTGPAR